MFWGKNRQRKVSIFSLKAYGALRLVLMLALDSARSHFIVFVRIKKKQKVVVF